MKCCQCGRPAFLVYAEGKMPLCIDCNLAFQQASAIQLEQNERMMNFITSHMELTTGLPGLLPKFPPRVRPVHVQGGTYHHVHIENSSVGLVNTGSIAQLDSAITVISDAGRQQTAMALKTLTQAVLDSDELSEDQRRDIVDMLNVVAVEGSLPKEQRKNGVIRPILTGLESALNGASSLVTIWQATAPFIRGLFA